MQANLATVQLSSGGQMSVFNSVSLTDVIVDIEGYSLPPGVRRRCIPQHVTRADLRYARRYAHELRGNERQPARIEHMARGRAVGNPVHTEHRRGGRGLQPHGDPGKQGHVPLVAPPDMSTDKCPSSAPTSNLNPRAGEALANRVIVPLGPRQDVCVYNSLGSIDFIIDVNGWFGDGTESPAGALFYPVAPTRICDTRAGSPTRCAGQFLAAGSTETIQVAGVAVVPRDGGSTPPVAVVANLTGVAGTANTYLSMYPGDVTQRPGVSDLNPSASEVIANLAVVALATTGGSSGAVDLFNAAGDINAILDIAGWFQ